MKRLLSSRSTTAVFGLTGLFAPLLGGVIDTTETTVAAVVDAAVYDDGRALVHVADDADLDRVADRAGDAGLHVTSRYDAIDVFHAAGTASQLETLATDPQVARLEHDRPIEVFTDTSHDATRGSELLAGEVDDLGVVDGAGVGVAVVDSGVDGLHPDLVDRMGENVKVLPGGTAIPFPDTDLISLGGHGTHVAGIVAGTGAASDGTYTGAAPGSTIHGVSGGTLISLHSAMDALDWVLSNHDRVAPAIRVVNNSWGSTGEHDPNSAVTRLVNELVDAGVLVVFAAGNSGGDGSAVRTSPECTNPTPGVVCVASYDDLGQGTRDGSTSSFSSRGDADREETWPDLAAPGSDIVAACRPTLPICATGSSFASDPLHYSSLSGTSMAAPHIAGIAAQMLSVAPDLTPDELEALLVDTAESYGEPGYAQGAGLVDAVEAVRAAVGSTQTHTGSGDTDTDTETDEEEVEEADDGPPEHAHAGGRRDR